MKYFGPIGYGVPEEIRPGVFELQIIERSYYGDVLRNLSKNDNSGKVIDDLNINASLSIVADPFAYQNFQHIKYVVYMGAKWKVNTVDPQFPRLILTLGDVYNGQDE